MTHSHVDMAPDHGTRVRRDSEGARDPGGRADPSRRRRARRSPGRARRADRPDRRRGRRRRRAAGCTIEALDRRGKVLVVLTDGPALGLHFGMTGRLLRSGTAAAIERLAYGAGSDHDRWDRWVVTLDDG